MTKWTSETIGLPACRKRRVAARFDGGEVTSNGGVVLLRQVDRVLGLTAAVAGGLGDGRQRGKVHHRVVDMLRQRVFGIALGYEDLNDHDALRHDLAVQTAVERDRPLASAPTLCRFENRAEPGWAWTVHQVLVDVFIAAFAAPPEEIVLDVDATDDAVHGHQEGRVFHGDSDQDCVLPLYVFAGDHLLIADLRPADIDPVKHALGVLKRLVTRLRQAWPGVRIIVRADSGCCRWRLMRWCERKGIDDIVGLARNARLLLASLAYVLMAAIRRLGLRGTDHARAQCATLRLKLLKIGAVVTRNTRRVRLHLSSACPDRDPFRLVAARLDAG